MISDIINYSEYKLNNIETISKYIFPCLILYRNCILYKYIFICDILYVMQ